MTGETVSHYRILEKLGEGGMGVVYKAEDTKLRRTVALKFLPPYAADNRERFLREAQAAASLNHPNICTIHEIDDEHGFIAMEFIEGLSLKQKIETRPLPLTEALDIAIQTCSGLQAAHERGIVHRDIKPANLMLTPQGQVKITDFGLAQVDDRTRLTVTGASIGTPAYMSPEQTQGDSSDRRTDIWSLGVVVYEMLSGRLPFRGDSPPSVSYAIVHSEPEPLTAVRSGVPKELDRIAAKLLAKSPGSRYQNLSDLIVDLRSLNTEVRSETNRRIKWLPAAALVTAMIVAGVYFTARLSSSSSKQIAHARRYEVALGETVQYPVISPDGRKVAYVDDQHLFIRELDQLQPRRIADTEQALQPFWSPDSDWIGYAIGQDLWRSSVNGGSRVLIAHFARRLMGAAWHPDGSVVVALFQLGLFQVPAAGGEPQTLLAPDRAKGESDFHEPHWLPGGKTLLVATHSAQIRDWRILALRGQERYVLASSQDDRLASPVYSASGYVLFSYDRNRPGTFAVPIDAAALRAAGSRVQLSADGTYPSLSQDGILSYWRGGKRPGRIAVIDRAGTVVRASAESRRELENIAVSPDGRRVAADAYENANWDIWIHDLDTANWSRLTFSPVTDKGPTWSRDGSRIAFRSNFELSEISAVGGQVRVLSRQPGGLAGPRSGFGDVIFFPRGGIWFLKPGESPVRFLPDSNGETEPVPSPDGRHLAFVSRETRVREVYVTSFPSGQGRWIVSQKGGSLPRWSPRGDELFFVEGNTLMSSRVETRPQFRAYPPVKLFNGTDSRVDLSAGYDVFPDGKRFAVVQEDIKGPNSVVIVENWLAELQQQK